jgi:Zn-dependent peptidase ImmA (M78 family)
MELHGFILVRENVSCPNMDAVSRWQRGRPYVLFSAEVSGGPRNIWDLAHELAHMLLHSSVEVTLDNLEVQSCQSQFVRGVDQGEDRDIRTLCASSASESA